MVWAEVSLGILRITVAGEARGASVPRDASSGDSPTVASLPCSLAGCSREQRALLLSDNSWQSGITAFELEELAYSLE